MSDDEPTDGAEFDLEDILEDDVVEEISIDDIEVEDLNRFRRGRHRFW